MTGEIHENNLEMLDFNETCLHLGIRLDGRAKRWMELDAIDWRILFMLLTKPILTGGYSAASESKPLANLARFAEAAANFMDAEAIKKGR